jgi:hypothetical protein
MNSFQEAHRRRLAVDLEAGPLAAEVDVQLALLGPFLRKINEPLGS